MKYQILILLTTIITISCQSDKTIGGTEKTLEEQVIAPKVSSDPAIQNTITMLQGTWNSRDDKNLSITFDKNTRVETRDGKTLGKIRYFEIADQCNNDTSKAQKIVKAKAKYISMQDIDMCYFIKKITRNELILSYVGRNNTLRYIKKNGSKKSTPSTEKPVIRSKELKK